MSIMIMISIIISIIIIIGTYILNKIEKRGERLNPYECGIEPIEEKPGIETRERFYIKYYIIGIIFLIFDLEAILLYPFTTIIFNNLYQNMNMILPYNIFIIFMVILILGLIYEYNKGIFNK